MGKAAIAYVEEALKALGGIDVLIWSLNE